MSEKQILPTDIKMPLMINKKEETTSTTALSYELIDPMHYSFKFDVDEDITINMEESDNTSDNHFVDMEFDEAIPEKNRIYYAVAAASGCLTGVFSFVKLSEEELKKVDEWKEKNWKPIIIVAAELIGCKKTDYKSAAKYLVNQAIKRVKSDETAKEYMTLLTAHPTMAGLVFSLITQFSEKHCCITETGEISFKKVPDYYFIGETTGQKIVSAVMYWLFELAVNQAESKRNIIDNLKISGELLKKIKEFIKLPFFDKIKENVIVEEKSFSEWLRNIVEHTDFEKNDDFEENEKYIIHLMKIAIKAGEDAFPILINECLVRSLYILIRLCEIAKQKEIKTIEELKKIPVYEIVPLENRLLSGMCLAASASFVVVNVSVAALKAIAGKKANDKEFLNNFLTEINIPAIGRLIYACAKDSKFWGKDIKVIFHRKPKDKNAEDTDKQDEVEFDESAFESLTFTPAQARFLYCVENFAVQRDIERTSDTESAEKKKKWLKLWRSAIITGAKLPPDMENEFFFEDEEKLYDGIYELSKDKTSYDRFYLLTQELALFKPYFSLGSEDDSEFKKLKLKYDYVSDQFIRKQTIVSQAELENLKKTYKKYIEYMTGKTKKTISMIAGGAAITVFTGGLAFAYAPAIAAMIAGEAVVGLHGAALTSASLAFVGGGSLAAGGLGMAGGTAIITGGGALIGLASSGGASAVAALMSVPEDYWERQSAKILTHCKITLTDILEKTQSVNGILIQVNHLIEKTSDDITAIKAEENALDKEYIKRLENYLSCLKKVENEIKRLVK